MMIAQLRPMRQTRHLEYPCLPEQELMWMQIIDGEWYIVGETHNFLTIHLKTKQVLADFAARYKGRLPDVDFVVQTSDWLPPAFNGEGL